MQNDQDIIESIRMHHIPSGRSQILKLGGCINETDGRTITRISVHESSVILGTGKSGNIFVARYNGFAYEAVYKK